MVLFSGNRYQRGASMIEAAFAIPVVIFLLFGIIQWGIILMAQISVTNAAATGARLLILENPQINQESVIVQAARNTIFPPLDPNLLSVNVTPDPPKPNGVTATVACSYTLQLLIPFVVPGQAGGTLLITSDTAVR